MCYVHVPSAMCSDLPLITIYKRELELELIQTQMTQNTEANAAESAYSYA
jgi:hypothetical protein